MERDEKRKAEQRKDAASLTKHNSALDTPTRIGLAVGGSSAILAAVLSVTSGFYPVVTALVAAAIGFAYAINHHRRLHRWWIQILVYIALVAALLGLFSRPLRKLYAQENPTSEKTREVTYPDYGTPTGAIPFEMKANWEFAAITTAAGTAEFEGSFIRLKFDKVIVRSRQELPDMRLVSLRPAVATYFPDVDPHDRDKTAPWSPVEYGEKLEIGLPLEPTMARTFPAFERLIAYDGVRDMRHAWLVLEVALESGKGKDLQRGVAYSHSDRQIFHRKGEARRWWWPWPREPTWPSPSPAPAPSAHPPSVPPSSGR